MHFTGEVVMQPDRVRILGLPVDVVDMPSALSVVAGHIEAELPAGCIVAANPEKVYALRASSLLQRLFDSATLIVPDGIGVVWAIRLLEKRVVSRVPGADFMQEICGLAAQKGYRIFLYGSSEETSRGTVEVLERRFPGIDIVGRQNGYLPEDRMPDLIARINASKADVLFVALGTPRQEQWMETYLPQLDVRLCQGIGGTLDTIVGTVRRAPRFMQKLNLEWLFRLLCQPTRIWRQWRLILFVGDVLNVAMRNRRQAGRKVSSDF
jgi:N-acetylglucosaminyldiphosphoundecaprenol N-acetyl-beta-D-mannosaminyltransferase